jgi:hypothetical protein
LEPKIKNFGDRMIVESPNFNRIPVKMGIAFTLKKEYSDFDNKPGHWHIKLERSAGLHEIFQ